MSAPAQVTEAHIDLVRFVLDAEWYGSNVFQFTQAGTAVASDVRMAAQLIADSEARACDQLRAEVEAECLLNGKGAEREADLRGKLERAEREVERLKRDYDYDHKCLYEVRERCELWKQRAERAEEIADRWGKRAISLEAELATERAKVRVLHSALQNLADEQNGAPLERRREEWQEAMDEACAVLAATEEAK